MLVATDWAQKQRVTSQPTVGGSSQQVPVGYGYCNCAPFNPSDNIAPDKYMLESTTRNINKFRSSLFCSIGNIVKLKMTREVP